MKPAKFNFLAPEDLGEVLACLDQYGTDARVLAGGLSLGAMLNYRLVDVSVLADISSLKELSYIRRDGDWIEIGAATTQAELLAWPDLSETLPLLALALPEVGHYQTRSRGTVCGSISHCEPTSEIPLCFRLLNGEAVLRSRKGERRLSAEKFQRGMLANACRPDELVVAVRFPVCTPSEGYAFREFAQRRGDFAIVVVAAVADATTVTVAVGGVADRPYVTAWRDLDEQNYDSELNKLAWTLGGYTDIHADAAYRRGLVRSLGRKVIEEARNNAAV